MSENNSLISVNDLKNLTLSERESAFFEYAGEDDKLKFKVNQYYFSLAGDHLDDPIRRQFMPTIDEFSVKSYELTDPLGEVQYSPVPRLVHRYRDRVLMLVTDTCAMYCRHCFRRSFTGHDAGVISSEELSSIVSYLAEHKEVNEILLSGGDPLTCSDRKIKEILQAIRSARPEMVIRLASRIPAVQPSRITDELVNILKDTGPLWLVTQFNHKREFSPEAIGGIGKIVDSGIPMLNQSVLLKGVNDSVETLEDLCQSLVRLRIKPYYLFQGDLASGTSHFRVPLEKGYKLMSELRQRISGLALPVYAVDMPGGGGKIPLTENFSLGKDETHYYFKNIEGKEYSYPREK